ncbi:acyl-CoA synthetase (AMP-forming)/AMP-acid ligase II [Frankia torreyi]|uniref:Acyl-CoA synthetase (AMP-forming)/AMP-acid ligase II n=2 Tax=Frankia TaxID=1854 RepID=A0A0D8BC12_9ACTN|nr:MULTISPECIES: AMP-binding protein [Frankia]KJE21813.1 acyl-CoA synthetase (AMP-forming)/AMP-acid ligase II [Frankia torreyi]KQC38204.1 acyl-CoA synthetase [Frankia sp. ACN1ag]
MLIGDIARRNARRYPDKAAVVYEDEELSWRSLDQRANRIATYLLGRGLVKGDRVAVCARNTPEWPEITYGLAKAGLVLVPINIRLSGPEVDYVLSDSGARAAIVHTDHVDGPGAPLAALDTVIEIGGDSVGVNYAKALAAGRDADPTPADLTDSDIHLLLYTSGTTGRPKAVVHEHRTLLSQVLDTTISTESRHDDVFLATTPFFTAGGMIRTLSWMYLGQTMVIHPRFDPVAVLETIERWKVTMTTFIPTMLIRTLRELDNRPGIDVSSLRRISYGSAPAPPGLAEEAARKLGCDLQQRYGSTEAGGQVTILTPEDHRAIFAGDDALRSSCGRETPHAEIRIVGEDGVELPRGEVGEIVVKADSVARGYWNRPEANAETFRPDGLWTGDLGRLDERGYLHIAGRKTDMIISGGFNVYPAEIERVLGAHPNVDLVAVVGIPHPEWGETPIAVVVPKGDITTEDLEAQLRTLSREQLAGYKQPRGFAFRTQMPLGPAGKILKRELRAELAAPESP